MQKCVVGFFSFNIMDLTLLSLIETTKPTILYFNESRVLTNGYMLYSHDGRRIIEICVACINGVWAVKTDVSCYNWGTACPIMKGRDFKFPSLKDALDSAWTYLKSRFENSNDTSQKEMKVFRAEYKKYLSMPCEEYFKSFKETNFYQFA